MPVAIAPATNPGPLLSRVEIKQRKKIGNSMTKTWRDFLPAASSIVAAYRKLLPSGIELKCEGSPDVPTDSLHDALYALTQGLPDLMKAYTSTIAPTEQAIFEAKKVLAPQEQALNYGLVEKYAPLLNLIGQKMAASNAAAQQASDRELTGASGQVLAKNVSEIGRTLDPEFYANRAVTSDAYRRLIGELDPTRLSEAELAATERGVNRLNFNRGTSESPSNTGAVANALQFSDRLAKKRNDLNQVLSNFGQIQVGSSSKIDPAQLTTGKPAIPAYNQNQLTGSTPAGFNKSPLDLTQSLLGESGAINRNNTSLNADRTGVFTNTMNSLPDY